MLGFDSFYEIGGGGGFGDGFQVNYLDNPSWDSGGGGYAAEFGLAPATGGGGGGFGIDLGGTGIQVQIPTSGGSGGGGVDVKEALTALANAAEAALWGNLGAWQAGQIDKSNALARAWAILDDMVRRMFQYGTQGQLSAAERDRRIDPSLLKWDWISYYIDPISGGGSVSPLPVLSGGTGALPGTIPVSTAGFGVPGVPDWFLIGLAVLGLLYLSRR